MSLINREKILFFHGKEEVAGSNPARSLIYIRRKLIKSLVRSVVSLILLGFFMI